MKKIIVLILLNSPFDFQNYNRTGIHFLTKYFHVVVLDCTSWLASNINKVDYEKHDYKTVEKVHNEKEFIDIIKKLKPDYAIDYLGNVNNKIAVFNILKKAGVKYVVQRLAPIVEQPIQKKILSSILRDPRKLLERLFTRFSIHTNLPGGLSPDIAIVAGSKYLDNFTAKSRNIIKAGSQDYYIYKSCKESSKKVEFNSGNPFILFMDDCIAESNDYLLTSRKNKIEPHSYYQALKQLLKNIELVSGIPVVVAAHPNGKAKQNYCENFGNREIYYGLTAELSEQCNLALTHHSTAISFPVLWRKPIIIITVESLNPNISDTYCIKNIIYYLKCPQLSINGNILDVKRVFSQNINCNEKAYKNFINTFIRESNVKEGYYYEAFIDYVKENALEMANKKT